MKSLQSMRDQMIAKMVHKQVRAFINGTKVRPCASCGTEFTPRQRWHFLCSGDCRRLFYRGVFKPRMED